MEIIYPEIISASRITDVPGFHSEFFINAIKNNNLIWTNQFNKLQQKIIKFDNTKVFIFWSKNPKPLLNHLKYLDNKGFVYYFQFTLNDYEKFELNIPKLNERIDTFLDLSERIGKHKVIWRYDPIIFSNIYHKDDILEKIENIGNKIFNHTEKMIFSFLDLYKKVENKFKKNKIELINEDKNQFIKDLLKLNEKWGLELNTCAENEQGIKKGQCIDPYLIQRIYPLFKFKEKNHNIREGCNCYPSKDIGQYGTCKHNCLYCYA